MSLTEQLDQELQALASRGLLRDPDSPTAWRAAAAAARSGSSLLNACSNDYLGLASHVSRETDTGAGASRLIHGSHATHLQLESALATWLGAEAALLFSSGYAANLGLLSALISRDDLVVSDELNHASIIDGCRLSRATVRVYPHLDLEAAGRTLRQPGPYARRWLVTESYFSMDADCPDLATLRQICDEVGAFLVVDEAHALGVFGAEGRGLCDAAAIRPEALVGTFGKAFGAHGAFVSGSATLRTWLWNRARSFVFSTATSPALAATLTARLPVVRAADSLRAELQSHEARLLGACDPALLPAGRRGPIFPLLCGSPERAAQVEQLFADRGILVQSIRPPTVPEGACRVRLTLSARFTWNDVTRLVDALSDACEMLSR